MKMSSHRNSSARGNNQVVSTPIRTESPLVRRSILVTPIRNNNETGEVDIQQERLCDVSTASKTKKRATRGEVHENSNVLSNYRDCFMSAIKLFQMNKITKQNIWDLNLIRDFYHLVDMRDESVVGDLHLASVALDASTKIYSMRVDDVYHDITRLASGLMRSDPKTSGKKLTELDEDADNEDDGGNISCDTQTKKKNTKTRKRKQKSHITTDLPQINCDVDVMPELDKLFTCRAAMLGDAMSTDKLYSLTLENYKGRYVTDVHEMKLLQLDDTADTGITEKEKEYPVDPLIKWHKTVINPSLANFRFLDQDPEEQSVCDDGFSIQEIGLNSSQQEIAFDINADVEQIIPESHEEAIVPEDFPEDPPHSDDDENESISGEGLRIDRFTGRVLFQGSQSSKRLEYTYNPRITQIINNLIAGPRHWKLPVKHKKNSKNLFSVTGSKSTDTATKAQCARKKAPKHVQVDDNIDDELFKNTRSNKIKGSIMLNWNMAKNLLPEDLELKFVEQNRAFLKPAKFFNKETVEDDGNATSVDDAVPDYDYQNHNDSNFCAIVENGNQYSDDDQCENVAQQQSAPSTQELVDAPDLVDKVTIKYDTKARTVDMKLVKKHTWRIIESRLKSDPDRGMMFSELFVELHKALPHSETENLTTGTASLAVMHIVNDNNLELSQDDCKDFKISLPK